MQRDKILSILRQALPELRDRYGVKDLAIFGSVARDEAREDSDVDVLVTYQRPAGLLEYMGLREDLETRLGRKVDLTTPSALKPRMKPAVEKDLVRVA